MTIRIQHLTIDDDDRSWLQVEDGEDVTYSNLYTLDLLSVVRHIMRERGDGNIIPIVRRAVIHPVNKWGHNMQVEVTYHTKGYRAIYGAHHDFKVTNVQCYMD